MKTEMNADAKAIDVQRLVRCGWDHGESGKAAVIEYETANNRIGWRYKGAKRVYESDKSTFLRKFSSPNGRSMGPEGHKRD